MNPNWPQNGKTLLLAATFFGLIFFSGIACDRGNKAKKETLVYSSLDQDLNKTFQAQLAADFPELNIRWVHGTTEEITAKVGAELTEGEVKADVVIAADRFFFEEMAKRGALDEYDSPATKDIPSDLKHASGAYTVLALGGMVIGLNSEIVPSAQAPKKFQDLSGERWNGKLSFTNPLASAEAFSALVLLQAKFGWDYFVKLRKSKTILEVGNQEVMRKIQSRERPIGIVSLEAALRGEGEFSQVKGVLPEEGIIPLPVLIGIIKSSGSMAQAEKIVDWMFGRKAQLELVKRSLYSPIPSLPAPEKGPSFAKFRETEFKWTPDILELPLDRRIALKEKFAEIMFE